MFRFGDDKPAKPAAPTGSGGWSPSDSDWTAFLARHPKFKGKKPNKPNKPAPPRAQLAAALGPPPAYSGGGASGGSSGGGLSATVQQATQIAQAAPSMVSAASSAFDDISAALSGEMGDELQESSDWGLSSGGHHTSWKTPTHFPGLADPAGLASFGDSDESSETNASDGSDPNEIENYRLNTGVAGVGNIMIGAETPNDELIDGDNYDFGFEERLYNGYDRAWVFGVEPYGAPAPILPGRPTAPTRAAPSAGMYGRGGYGRIPSRSIYGGRSSYGRGGGGGGYPGYPPARPAPSRPAPARPAPAAPQTTASGYWCQRQGEGAGGLSEFYYSKSAGAGCTPVFGADQVELTEDIPGAIENTGDFWAPPDADFFYDMELNDDAADFDVDDEILADGDLGEVNEILGGGDDEDKPQLQKGRRR